MKTKVILLFTFVFLNCTFTFSQIKTWQEISDEANARVGHITADTLLEKLNLQEDLLLVDVRTAEEYNACHIEGSVSITRGQLEAGIVRVTEDPLKVIVLYCGSGHRAALATEALASMGYTNVLNLTGGIRGWVNAGYPVVNALGRFVIAPEETTVSALGETTMSTPEEPTEDIHLTSLERP